MMHPDQLRQLIADSLPCVHLAVNGDGQHFEAVIVSAEFAGKSRVQRQQRVYQGLKAHLDSGELHALSMKTLTPEEWKETEAKRG
jgi:acid stress-induced BolA-like protein IbaG/YrbA